MANCPVFQTMGLVGRKWTVPVLQEVASNGARGFNNLFYRLKRISPKVLTSRLRELEEAGIIERKVIAEPQTRTAYHLTEKGRELQGIILQLRQWNTKYADCPEAVVNCGTQECVTCLLY